MICKFCRREVVRVTNPLDYIWEFPLGLLNVLLTKSWFKHKGDNILKIPFTKCKALYLSEKCIEG